MHDKIFSANGALLSTKRHGMLSVLSCPVRLAEKNGRLVDLFWVFSNFILPSYQKI